MVADDLDKYGIYLYQSDTPYWSQTAKSPNADCSDTLNQAAAICYGRFTLIASPISHQSLKTHCVTKAGHKIQHTHKSQPCLQEMMSLVPKHSSVDTVSATAQDYCFKWNDVHCK